MIILLIKKRICILLNIIPPLVFPGLTGYANHPFAELYQGKADFCEQAVFFSCSKALERFGKTLTHLMHHPWANLHTCIAYHKTSLSTPLAAEICHLLICLSRGGG
jgi:hypothetical protein